MTGGRLQQHARERLHFTGEVSKAERLDACKTFLRLEGAMVRMRHEAEEPGSAIAAARAASIDALLSHLFDYALATWARATGGKPVPVALVALGGYGRGELCPHSDIDVMFLFPAKAKPEALKPIQEHLINEVLYLLWDCSLKVGHSSRTVDEVFVEARKDIQTKTALLEARLVAGSTQLYEPFAIAYRSFYTSEDPRGYITSRLADQRDRRAKYGDTVFLQEPDIKSGVGGLRDFQNTIWMAQVKLGIEQLDDLVDRSYLRPNELKAFRTAHDFLLRVRCELHFISKRPTDLLDLAVQPVVALNLGYRNPDLVERVEQFMRDYYRAAQTIFRTSKLVENRLALAVSQTEQRSISFREVLRARRFERVKRIDGFVLRGQELAADSPQVFRQDPVRLIRIFRHCQQLGCTPDLALQTLIRESLPLITRSVIVSADANVSFGAIMTEAGGVYPSLSLMHELGVLGRFIPEFDQLTCLVQHEFYHRYTADIHTLHAIRELDRVYAEDDLLFRKYRLTLHETENPTLLYLILLLHDIGKAHGIQGHAESGVKIAEPLLERLRVPPGQREVVTFVIKNHLAMARFWQKRDVDDPSTAAAFADIVLDAERLRYLYVHTFCDARGTSSGLWNGYKDTLHTSLYRATLERLTLGDAVISSHHARKQMTHQELLAKKIPGVGHDEITAHFNLLPERYFIHTDAAEIALHLQMVNRLLQSITMADSIGTLKPIVDWKDDLNRSLTVVNVVTWDRAGLFSKLAGAFSVAGLNILSAKVISRADHIAIDTFYVVEPGRGVVQNSQAMATFERTVEAALVQNKDLLPDILAQARRLAAANRYSTARAGEELHSSFPPTVDVYQELSMQRTIVEIQARDQMGLLYRVANTIYEHGFDITFARIGTERGVAIDTFYIENASPQPISDSTRLLALRDALAVVITVENPVAAAS